MKGILYFLTQFVFVLIGGNMASIGYVIAIFFSVVGGILIFNVEKTFHIVVAICLALFGLVLLFFRVRADVIEIKKDIKNGRS